MKNRVKELLAEKDRQQYWDRRSRYVVECYDYDEDAPVNCHMWVSTRKLKLPVPEKGILDGPSRCDQLDKAALWAELKKFDAEPHALVKIRSAYNGENIAFIEVTDGGNCVAFGWYDPDTNDAIETWEARAPIDLKGCKNLDQLIEDKERCCAIEP